MNTTITWNGLLVAFITLILLLPISLYSRHIFSERQLHCDTVLTISVHNLCQFFANMGAWLLVTQYVYYLCEAFFQSLLSLN